MSAEHILVVDDDRAIRDMVQQALEFEGHTVETAADGVEALAAIERAHPAMVLLDMRMPLLDGWGVVRELKARAIGVPVVVMTAAQDARRWAEEAGAAAYLAKPFDLPDLFGVLERARARA
ncbi:MAG TPA: response regulator [Chloroflexota bacterium]|jgi:two-component system response regulator MprA|nr:response regulator [Chloroflexota bacterium]